jgi:Fe-S-cluster containining protein
MTKGNDGSCPQPTTKAEAEALKRSKGVKVISQEVLEAQLKNLEIDCMECQMCCRTLIVPVAAGEKSQARSRRSFLIFADTWGFKMLKWGKKMYMAFENPCQHIDSEKGCLIYEKRPFICRKFEKQPDVNLQCYLGAIRLKLIEPVTVERYDDDVDKGELSREPVPYYAQGARED